MSDNELALRYGMNPHQKPARVYMRSGNLPFKVLNGAPGYINMLDALNSWQLVKELKAATGLPAAASFKHVSPAGAAVGVPLSDALKQAYFVGDAELTPLATAYTRARGADRMSSFGDFAALSDVVDVATARLMRHEVSDGVIAPGYEPEAIKLLSEKKGGNYPILQIDPDYVPEELEVRQIFGVMLEQKRNDAPLGPALLENIVTQNKNLPDPAKTDLLVALITLKYLQSNSVCFTLDGQVIGAGAGQQSRIHCVRLAAEKAERWYLRQHPIVLNFQYKDSVKRVDRDNLIDLFFEHELTAAAEAMWRDSFEVVPERLTHTERRELLAGMQGVSLGSDAFFPFRDSIDRAYLSGVKYVAQPGGSIRDDAVIQACDEYGMVMINDVPRLFHH